MIIIRIEKVRIINLNRFIELNSYIMPIIILEFLY